MAITLSTDGYCEATDVASLLQQWEIGAATDPTTAELEAWITEDFNEINSRLRAVGYAAPIAQSGGSLAVSAGNIVVDAAADAGATSIILTGSGGALSGKAGRGDFLTVANDDQRYMILYDSYVNDSGDVGVFIAPALEKDAAASAVVTFVAVSSGSSVLKKLNSQMSAIRVLQTKFAGFAEGLPEQLEPMQATVKELIEGIEKGRFDFPSAAKPSSSGRVNRWVKRA